MSILHNRKRPRPPMPGWMKIAMIGFLVFAGINGYRGAEDPASRAPSIENYPALSEFVSLDSWRAKLNPDLGRIIETREVAKGMGDIAVCGQEVVLTVHYPEAGVRPLPEDFSLPTEPISFTIGDGSQPALWDRAVRGMRQGGVRQILAGPQLVEPLLTPTHEMFAFELQLVSLTPFLENEARFRAAFIETGRGEPALCGQRIALRLRPENETLWSDASLITLGEATLGHGIDRALIGMRPRAQKHVQIPAPYSKSGKMQLVEIERLPYIDEESTPTPEPEADEPDRQSP